MNGGVEVVRILWRSAELQSAERFTGRRTPEGWSLEGLVVLPLDGEPAQVSYRVDVDPGWRTRRADVAIDREGGARRIELAADGSGGWAVDGEPVEALTGCVDVDLGFTPATNTLPIRRLGGEAGRTRSVPVAWLAYPELDVRRGEQLYTRMTEGRWLFRSGDFSAELDVDAGGYVLRYGDGLWDAVVHRTG